MDTHEAARAGMSGQRSPAVDSTRKQARTAGLLYLLGGITAPFSLIYVPRALIVPGDAAATGERLRASGTLLHLAIASELFVAVMFTLVALALYDLLERVDRRLAVAMAALLLLSVPISFVNVLGESAALLLARGAPFLLAFSQEQRDALASLCLRLHGQGLHLAAIFWGLWLFPFGKLVMRSGFIPRALGVLLMIAGTGYVVGASTSLLVPAYANLVRPIMLVLEIGELPIVLWLLLAPSSSARTSSPTRP